MLGSQFSTVNNSKVVAMRTLKKFIYGILARIFMNAKKRGANVGFPLQMAKYDGFFLGSHQHWLFSTRTFLYGRVLS
jgi:hypothetical protein